MLFKRKKKAEKRLNIVQLEKMVSELNKDLNKKDSFIEELRGVNKDLSDILMKYMDNKKAGNIIVKVRLQKRKYKRDQVAAMLGDISFQFYNIVNNIKEGRKIDKIVEVVIDN